MEPVNPTRMTGLAKSVLHGKVADALADENRLDPLMEGPLQDARRCMDGRASLVFGMAVECLPSWLVYLPKNPCAV